MLFAGAKKAIDPRYHNINKLIIQKKKYYLRHVDSDFFFKGWKARAFVYRINRKL